MSLHRTDYMVSSHQSELARHAANARLARTAKGAATTERRGGLVSRMLSGLSAAVRPDATQGAPAPADATHRAATVSAKARTATVPSRPATAGVGRP